MSKLLSSFCECVEKKSCRKTSLPPILPVSVSSTRRQDTNGNQRSPLKKVKMVDTGIGTSAQLAGATAITTVPYQQQYCGVFIPTAEHTTVSCIGYGMPVGCASLLETPSVRCLPGNSQSTDKAFPKIESSIRASWERGEHHDHTHESGTPSLRVLRHSRHIFFK